MQNITLQISEDELREVTQAYQVLQSFLAKIISPNELYKALEKLSRKLPKKISQG